jgi:hypothetical protein
MSRRHSPRIIQVVNRMFPFHYWYLRSQRELMSQSDLSWFIRSVASRERQVSQSGRRYQWRALRANAVDQFESRFGSVPSTFKLRRLSESPIGPTGDRWC